MRKMHPLWHVRGYEDVYCPLCKSYKNIVMSPSSILGVQAARCRNDDCPGDTTPEDASSGYRKPHAFLVYVDGNRPSYDIPEDPYEV